MTSGLPMREIGRNGPLFLMVPSSLRIRVWLRDAEAYTPITPLDALKLLIGSCKAIVLRL